MPLGPYRKSWCKDNIFGSSRFEFSQSMRGIWNDLLDLAKISRVPKGLIAPSKGVAYSHEYLAHLLNTPIDEFENALCLLKDTKRISENGQGIQITNWRKYQSEYDRQKPYREAKKKKSEDPDKFTRGRYGHMVQR